MRVIECSNCNHLSIILQNNNNDTALSELGGGLGKQENIARCLGI